MSITDATIVEAGGAVAGLLRRRIKEGSWDGALPSERRLSEELNVGRAALRKALDELSKEGLVRRSGPRLRTVVRPASVNDGAAAWMKKSVAVLAPQMAGDAPTPSRARWLRFVTLGTVDALRAVGLHAITLNVAELSTLDIGRIAGSGPRGLLVPDLVDNVPQVSEWVATFRSLGVPVVVYGGHHDYGEIDRVVSDHEQGSYDLTRELISRGHRKIAQFWPRPWDRYWLTLRDRGYRRAMTEAGLEPQETLEFPALPFFAADEAGFDYCAKLVAGFMVGRGIGKGGIGKGGIDALMLGTDRDVFFAAAASRKFGLTPGEDVVLAGYDGYSAECVEWAWEPAGPALSVDKNNEQMGEAMVALLDDRAAGRLPPGPQVRVLSQRVVRPSARPAPAELAGPAGLSP